MNRLMRDSLGTFLVCVILALSSFCIGIQIDWDAVVKALAFLRVPANFDFVQMFAVMGLVYLCNWWVSHPPLACTRNLSPKETQQRRR